MKYDYTIIGAGIVGLATAYSICKKYKNSNIAVIEKENSFSMHQSGNNSNVIHSGIYYKPKSKKALNCKKGYKLLLEFIKKYEIPHDICGKLIVATCKSEENELNRIFKIGKQNGLENLKILNKDDIKIYEPYVDAYKAIHVPQAGITDYKLVSKKIYEILVQKGVKFYFNNEVTDIKSKKEGHISIITKNKNIIKTDYVINISGLYSDKLTKLSTKINYKIVPFRGEYYNLKPEARYLVKNLIYPVPNPNFPFLGVHFTRTIDNKIESGPNAVFAFRREGYNFFDFNFKEFFESIFYIGFIKIAIKYWKDGIMEIYRSINKRAYLRSMQKLIPDIKINHIERGNSGVRAQAIKNNGEMVDDFLIKISGKIINVCNAPSPAATACFAIGDEITNLIKKHK